MKFMTKAVCVVFTLIWALLLTSNAYADQCHSLANNEDWRQNMEHLQDEIRTENYEAAFESARVLYDICPISPALNYYLGMAFKGTGDDVKATMHFQKASEYTTQLSVSPEMSRLIWYARYEAEHPECSEFSLTALKQQNAALDAQTDSLKQDIAAQNARLDAVSNLNLTLSEKEREQLRKKYAILMWTGTGVGILGIASVVTGLVLVLEFDKYEDVTKEPNHQYNTQRTYDIRPSYTAGWSLFGAGIALAVTGSVMAGMGGYHYIRSNSDIAWSLDFAPTGAQFGMTF